MVQQRIGMVITAADSNAALRAVEDLDNRGVGAAWMTSGSTGGGDSLSVFSAAGPRTRSIMFGTAITQTFPRHPIAVAQQVLTLAQLAPRPVPAGVGHQRSGRRGADPWHQLPSAPGPPQGVCTHPEGIAARGLGGLLRALLPSPYQYPRPC